MSFVINRVYTGVGDRGSTRLAGGQEVPKTSDRIEAYGTLDELNAVIGVLVEALLTEGRADPARATAGAALVAQLRRIQNELFDLGGELAVLPEDRHPAQALLADADADRLERELDAANEGLPPLRSFVLPGGGMISALVHHARTVCRRAERRLVAVHLAEPQRPAALRYLNRLSDWLFVMGRRAAVDRGEAELLWKPGGAR